MELIRTEFKLRPATQGQRLNSNCGPLMQGVIMERIRPEYGEVLHISELKPYSQYLIHEANEDTWVLQTLTHDSGNEIWNIAAIKQLEKFRLEHNDMEIGVAERSFTKLSEDELLNQTFFGDCPRKVSVDFVTPTAFKSGGAYVNYPTIRHVFQSLLNKFNAVSTNSSLDVDMVLGDIENNIAVTGYAGTSEARSRYAAAGCCFVICLWTISMICAKPDFTLRPRSNLKTELTV